MTHHEAEADAAEARGQYARATEHWERAAVLSEWLETALAEMLGSADTSVRVFPPGGSGGVTPSPANTPVHWMVASNTPTLGEVDFEPPPWMGLTAYEELLELALDVFGASDRGGGQYDLGSIRWGLDDAARHWSTPDEVRQTLMSDAGELVQLPNGTLWERIYMTADDPDLPWDSERRAVRGGRHGHESEPGDFTDVWAPYTYAGTSRVVHERRAIGPLTIYARGGRPVPADTMWAYRVGRGVRRILGHAGRGVSDAQAVDALQDLYIAREEFRRRHRRRPRQNGETLSANARVEVEKLRQGAYALTLRHPKHLGQWAKFRIATGGNLLPRAMRAVYGPERAGDADAFFEAYGMADYDAFRAATWRNNGSAATTPRVPLISEADLPEALQRAIADFRAAHPTLMEHSWGGWCGDFTRRFVETLPRYGLQGRGYHFLQYGFGVGADGGRWASPPLPPAYQSQSPGMHAAALVDRQWVVDWTPRQFRADLPVPAVTRVADIESLRRPDGSYYFDPTVRENTRPRRPTAKIEVAVEATRVWLGSVDRVRARDEEKLSARAMRAIDAVAAHYGVSRDAIFEQIAEEARRRGLRLARAGQDI